MKINLTEMRSTKLASHKIYSHQAAFNSLYKAQQQPELIKLIYDFYVGLVGKVQNNADV